MSRTSSIVARMVYAPSLELVASFLARRSVSYAPRWRASAAYEHRAVRKMRAAPWQRMSENRRDRGVFLSRRSDFLIGRMSVLSHNFKRLERFAKLATSFVAAFPDGRRHGDFYTG